MMQEWYKRAKLGIFLHWGIYSVNGTSESWAFGSGSMSYNDYMKQLDGFTASSFDPDHWADIIKSSGAKYAILTAKHHDGVCLFDSKYTDLTVVKKTPAGRDLIREYCDAMHRSGLKTGIYFTNTDWSDMDHMEVLIDKTSDEIEKMHEEKISYSSMWPKQTKDERVSDNITVPKEKEYKWNKFLKRYMGEIEELVTKYGNIDIYWTDAMLYRKGYSWRTKNVRDLVMKYQPYAVINGRLDGYGDFLTSEQRLPLTAISDDVWEYVHTFNESWGYQPQDNHFKTIKQVVRLFTEALTMGANMLLGIGPHEDGTLPKEAEKMLSELGDWIRKYEEAIYPTNRGLAPNYFRGCSSISEDNKILYLFLNDRPNEKVMINGLRNKINKITCLTNGHELSYTITGGAPWGNIPGCKWIDISDNDLDPICTVLKLELDGVIDLWEIGNQGHFGAQDF